MKIHKSDLKHTPRKEQIEALDFIKQNIDNKFILLDLPVGVGKSYLSLLIADWFSKEKDKDVKFDILTGTKILQDQYGDEFTSIKNLKGKENYDCEQYSCSCAQGKEFNKLNKTKCEACPYDYAKVGFIGGDISLTNFYLYILYSLYNPKFLDERESRVLIVDECLHPDTNVTMYDGSKKKIVDITPGDLVLTVNETTGDIEIKPVVKLHHNLNKGEQMYEIEMENGDILKITGNHKVKLTTNEWRRVDELKDSDEILYIKEKTEPHDFYTI